MKNTPATGTLVVYMLRSAIGVGAAIPAMDTNWRERDTARAMSQDATTLPTEEKRELMLATTTVEDFDRFLNIFSTKGAEKRKQHGSKGATVFRDPNEADRVWVLFDWDEEGFQNFLSDPEVPPIIQEAGHKSRPQPAEFGGQYDS
jgi:hypothetical protein